MPKKRQNQVPISISDYLNPDHICFDLGTEKYEIIRRLFGILKKESPQMEEDAPVLEELIRREREISTAVGKGIAFPHVRLTSIKELQMAVALLKEGVDWESYNSEPVHIVILILIPEEQNEVYIQLISKLNRILNQDDLREQMLAASDSLTLYRLFCE